jgi:hypothetical protein
MKWFATGIGLIFWTWFAWLGGPVLLGVWVALVVGAFAYQRLAREN